MLAITNSSESSAQLSATSTLVDEDSASTVIGAFDDPAAVKAGHTYVPRCRRTDCNRSCGQHDNRNWLPPTTSTMAIMTDDPLSTRQSEVDNPTVDDSAAIRVSSREVSNNEIGSLDKTDSGYRRVPRCNRSNCDGTCGNAHLRHPRNHAAAPLAAAELAANKTRSPDPPATELSDVPCRAPSHMEATHVNPPHTASSFSFARISVPVPVTPGRPTVALPAPVRPSSPRIAVKIPALDNSNLVDTALHQLPRCLRIICAERCGAQHVQHPDSHERPGSDLPAATYRPFVPRRRRDASVSTLDLDEPLPVTAPGSPAFEWASSPASSESSLGDLFTPDQFEEFFCREEYVASSGAVESSTAVHTARLADPAAPEQSSRPFQPLQLFRSSEHDQLNEPISRADHVTSSAELPGHVEEASQASHVELVVGLGLLNQDRTTNAPANSSPDLEHADPSRSNLARNLEQLEHNVSMGVGAPPEPAGPQERQRSGDSALHLLAFACCLVRRANGEHGDVVPSALD